LKLNENSSEHGLQFEQEATVDAPYDLVFCDMIIRDKKVAIEIDGPYHYLFNDHSKILKKDVLTERVVESYGYKVIRVNVDNFNLMQHQEKRDLFSSIIKQIQTA
jgi:very-short-patch-repair endonuclease